MLAGHVVFIDALQGEKDLARTLIIAEPIEDVAGHMHHVPRGGCQLAELFGTF
jgi:hypothetical protein